MNVVGGLAAGTYLWSVGSVLTDANGDNPFLVSKLVGSGSLDLSGLSSSNKFNIQVTTLKADGTPGSMYDQNPLGTYSWTIATFAVGITNFSASEFTLDPGYAISMQGNNLVLTFSPVPEPTTTLAFGAGALAMAGWLRRRWLTKRPQAI